MDPAATQLAGPSLWQVGAALVVVLGLLVLALKLLGRLGYGGSGTGRTRLLATRKLGPKRELEILAVDDQVYTLYRRESGLVVLKTETREAYRARQPEPTISSGQAVGQRLRALVAAAGGGTRRETSP